MKISLIICAICLGVATPLYAQDDTTIVMDLLSRVEALEAEQRDLRGQLDEAHHALSLLQQKADTLSADIDHRLSGAGGEFSSPSLDSQSSAEDLLAALPSSTLEEEYEKARSLLEQGEYEAAEKAFAAIVSAHPKDNLAGPSQYWLGVTYFVRGQHEKAAASFAKGYKNYPKSSKAPDSLLKLAKSLGLLDRKADACTTLDQLLADHPKTSLAKEVSKERAKLGCK